MGRNSRDLSTNPATRKVLSSKSASPFVGREDELRRLETALALAAEGQGDTIFLMGQPGIGKTRLAKEALGLARKRGFTTLHGRCLLFRTGLAYGPFLDALGPLLRSLDAAQLATLVDGLPDLGRLFTGITLPQPEHLGDPALEKARLFETLARLLERLTRQAPVVLLVDDLHLAHPSSLELLHYVASGLSDQRALLLCTCNNVALNTLDDLRALILSLQRDGLAEEIAVLRLTADNVHELVQGILGKEVPQALLSLIDARADGTPLYIEAMISSLTDSGSLVHGLSENDGWVLGGEELITLAPNVRHLILGRLDRLRPDERRTLDSIAIMGEAAPHPIIEATSGLDRGTLCDILQHLEAAGLVSEELDGQDVVYSITHPLIQEVAYADLPMMKRRRGHKAIIEAIERTRPDDLNRLARHYRGAGAEADPGRAFAVLFAAGERSQAIYANEEAAQDYETALAFIRAGHHAANIPTRDGPVLPYLLERLGDVWDRIGKHESAKEAWREALGERERTGDIRAASRLHCRLAEAESDQGHFHQAEVHITSGLVLLKQGSAVRLPSQELADLYLTRCYILGRLGQVAAHAKSSAELLAIAEHLAIPLVEAKANLIAFTVSLERNDVVEARGRALHALMLAQSSSEGQNLAVSYRAHRLLALVGMRLGDHYLMRDHAQHALALAQSLGAPSYEIPPRLHLAYADYLSGDWNESLRNMKEAITLARRVGHPRELAYSLAERAVLLALRGELSEAAACISEVRTTFGRETLVDRSIFGLVDIAETAIALEQGETKHALGIARGFVRQSATATAPADLTCISMPVGLMLLAEAQAAGGDPDGALETARKIGALGPPDAPYLTGLAFRAEGLGRQARGEEEAAVRCLQQAYGLFSDLEIPFEAARSLLEQATIVRNYRPELAREAGRQSLAIFERLGARCHVDRSRQLLRSLGVALPVARQDRLGGGLLSSRELKVARLIAEGLATAEVADRLGVSRRTIGAHLDHVYRRLHIGSRAALTRYVIEAGLLSPRENDK